LNEFLSRIIKTSDEKAPCVQSPNTILIFKDKGSNDVEVQSLFSGK
jgi:hypothetical protein